MSFRRLRLTFFWYGMKNADFSDQYLDYIEILKTLIDEFHIYTALILEHCWKFLQNYHQTFQAWVKFFKQ